MSTSLSTSLDCADMLPAGTSDISRAHRVAARLDAGNVAVNGGTSVNGPFAPFGGFKDSGYGKEGGLAGILEYTRMKNVNIWIDPA